MHDLAFLTLDIDSLHISLGPPLRIIDVGSEEELGAAVAGGEGNGNGHHHDSTSAIPHADADGLVHVDGENVCETDEEEDGEEHDWDCHMTDLAALTYPPGQAEADPIKVNEYAVDGFLGAGAFGNVKRARREVGPPPYQTYAIKIMSRHRLRRFKSSVMSVGGSHMEVKTGIDMVSEELAKKEASDWCNSRFPRGRC